MACRCFICVRCSGVLSRPQGITIRYRAAPVASTQAGADCDFACKMVQCVVLCSMLVRCAHIDCKRSSKLRPRSSATFRESWLTCVCERPHATHLREQPVECQQHEKLQKSNDHQGAQGNVCHHGPAALAQLKYPHCKAATVTRSRRTGEALTGRKPGVFKLYKSLTNIKHP